MSQITYIQHRRIDTDRYSLYTWGRMVNLVCNKCRTEEDLPMLLLTSLDNPSVTSILSSLTRHEDKFHFNPAYAKI